MQEEVTSPVLFLILAAAATWLLRRLLPAVECPHCRNGSWILMKDRKQCARCGRLFV
jgi:DNA-directed RNA polymerase subunit RPC12/RpoP